LSARYAFAFTSILHDSSARHFPLMVSPLPRRHALAPLERPDNHAAATTPVADKPKMPPCRCPTASVITPDFSMPYSPSHCYQPQPPHDDAAHRLSVFFSPAAGERRYFDRRHYIARWLILLSRLSAAFTIFTQTVFPFPPYAIFHRVSPACAFFVVSLPYSCHTCRFFTRYIRDAAPSPDSAATFRDSLADCPPIFRFSSPLVASGVKRRHMPDTQRHGATEALMPRDARFQLSPLAAAFAS
jgi:hypothetical protein